MTTVLESVKGCDNRRMGGERERRGGEGTGEERRGEAADLENGERDQDLKNVIDL